MNLTRVPGGVPPAERDHMNSATCLDIVMRGRITRVNVQRRQVMRESLRPVAAFIEKIAQVEMRQSILRIYFQRPPVLTLGLRPIARVEMYRAQVHQRARRPRIEF